MRLRNSSGLGLRPHPRADSPVWLPSGDPRRLIDPVAVGEDHGAEPGPTNHAASRPAPCAPSPATARRRRGQTTPDGFPSSPAVSRSGLSPEPTHHAGRQDAPTTTTPRTFFSAHDPRWGVRRRPPDRWPGGADPRGRGDRRRRSSRRARRRGRPRGMRKRRGRRHRSIRAAHLPKIGEPLGEAFELVAGPLFVGLAVRAGLALPVGVTGEGSIDVDPG